MYTHEATRYIVAYVSTIAARLALAAPTLAVVPLSAARSAQPTAWHQRYVMVGARAGSCSSAGHTQL